ncbi:MAG: hypothetical protein IJU63_01870 [Bacteroidales bacterium]|nr:hypothetical protein [Bacteroidales bacterium]
MKSLLFAFLFFLSFVSSVYAQRPDVNQYNASGEKDGLWIERTKTHTWYDTYKDGKREGLGFYTNQENEIAGFATSHDNQPIGTFVDCDRGRISFIVFDCGKNTLYSITDINGKLYFPDYKGYFISFSPEGKIESEGILVWNKEDSLEIDSIEYGEWKYYDKSGNVTVKQFAL